jgi:hypothetical protein
MSLDPAAERALRRLRANAARAGGDAGAYLRNAELFARPVIRLAPSTLPDDLKDGSAAGGSQGRPRRQDQNGERR